MLINGETVGLAERIINNTFYFLQLLVVVLPEAPEMINWKKNT